MCFMASIVEIIAVITAILSAVLGAQLQDFNIPNIHFPYVIVMSVVIPFIYLLNDDSEKEIIFQGGWYQGFRYALGIYTTPNKDNGSSDGNKIHVARLTYNQNLSNFLKISRSYSMPRRPDGSISPRKITSKRCLSAVELRLQLHFGDTNEIVHSNRRHSAGYACPDVLVSSLINSTIHNTHTSIELPFSRNNSQLKKKMHLLKSSSSSIDTLYLD